ncbi:hypothetical protein D3C78_1540640 [compost metagenome]
MAQRQAEVSLHGLGRSSAARGSQTGDAKHLADAHHCQRTGQGQRHRQQRPEQMANKARGRTEMEQSLIDQPFTGETVQWRQCGHGHQADQQRNGGPGHQPCQPAHFLHVLQPGLLFDGARRQQQCAFEQAVVQQMEQATDQGERRH